MHATARPNDRRRTDHPTTTTHAELRYLQRVDPHEPFPAAALQEMFQRAHLDRCCNISGTIYHDPQSGQLLVVDDGPGRIVTVLGGGQF